MSEAAEDGWSVDVLLSLAHHAVSVGCEVSRLDERDGMHVLRPRGERVDRDMTVLLGLTGSWLHSGLPSVLVTQSALPALSTTDPAQRPSSPWRVWVIKLPDEQRDISLVRSNGSTDAIRALVVLAMGEQWCYFAFGGHLEYTEIGRTAEQLADVDWTDGLASGLAPVVMETTEHDRVAIRKMRRLVLNTSLALDEIDGVRRIGMERGARDRGRLPAGDYVIEAYGMSGKDGVSHG